MYVSAAGPAAAGDVAAEQRTAARRAVIIRWIALARREMQNYAPLCADGSWELLGVGSQRPDHDLSQIGFPVVQPASLDAYLLRVGGLAGLLERLTRLKVENLNYMPGLERHLAGADIVDLAETFHLFGYQVARARAALGFKLVVSVHETIPFSHENLWTRRKTKEQIYASADHFFTLSRLGKEALALEGVARERISVVPTMGVDTERFRPLPRDAALIARLGIHPDELVILFVGRLTWAKGVFELLNAFKLLVSDPPPGRRRLRLLIVGGGEEASAIRARARRLAIDAQTTLVERVPYEEMPLAHNLADIFVLPSNPTPKWNEQFGAALAESMACGRAVVGATSGAIAEVIGDAGLLVPPGDFVALAAALRRLVADQDRRDELGARARERALAAFSTERIAGQIRRAYERVLSQ